jgi:MscS family membrane protein
MNNTFGFLQHKFYKNTIEDWLISLAIIALSMLFARAIYWLISTILRQLTKHTKNELDNLILQKIDTPVALCIILIGFRFAIERIEFTKVIDNYLQRGFVFISALAITWLLTRIVRVIIEHYFTQYKDTGQGTQDEQMLSISKRTSVIVLWSIGVIVGLNNAGFDVGALIAGLGIGGLAVALAAQETVKNIIGGLIVFIDKPFRLGDVVKLGEIEGTVSHIGIRSTRIRTPAGRLITLPNAKFTESSIENITLEPSRRVIINLGLVYQTSPQKMNLAIELLKGIMQKSPNVNESESVIFFENFAAYSLDIKCTYFILKSSNIFETQHEINLEILSQFNAAELEFAYPTQTSYEHHVDKSK